MVTPSAFDDYLRLLDEIFHVIAPYNAGVVLETGRLSRAGDIRYATTRE
jgi:hypothetical protein